jgi:DNA-binding MurR/RpiR family transcriptional regulator
MNIAILKTGLFPDAETVEDALNHFVVSDYLFAYDATRADLTEADWDQALDEIMAAERVFVI